MQVPFLSSPLLHSFSVLHVPVQRAEEEHPPMSLRAAPRGLCWAVFVAGSEPLGTHALMPNVNVLC